MNAQPVRINIRRLLIVTVLCLALPLLVGLAIDLAFGIAPAATLIAGLFAIPIASVVVGRMVLTEFNLVIEQVAPEEPPVATDAAEVTRVNEGTGEKVTAGV